MNNQYKFDPEAFRRGLAFLSPGLRQRIGKVALTEPDDSLSAQGHLVTTRPKADPQPRARKDRRGKPRNDVAPMLERLVCTPRAGRAAAITQAGQWLLHELHDRPSNQRFYFDLLWHAVRQGDLGNHDFHRRLQYALERTFADLEDGYPHNPGALLAYRLRSN